MAKKLQIRTDTLTLSPNLIKYRKGEIQIVCDIRYPATTPLKDVTAHLDQFGVKYETLHHQEPLRQNKYGELVTTLLAVYEECTGIKSEPVSIGGGTYARALKCGAAFGPEEDGEECTIHQPDEYITFEKIRKCFEIYKLALEKLCG